MDFTPGNQRKTVHLFILQDIDPMSWGWISISIYKCNLYVKFHMYSYVWFATDCNDDLTGILLCEAARNCESRMPHLLVGRCHPKIIHLNGNFDMGLSENRVYSQWNSHLIGIMISKTIGFRGTLFSDTPILSFLMGKQFEGPILRTPQINRFHSLGLSKLVHAIWSYLGFILIKY